MSCFERGKMKVLSTTVSSLLQVCCLIIGLCLGIGLAQDATTSTVTIGPAYCVNVPNLWRTECGGNGIEPITMRYPAYCRTPANTNRLECSANDDENWVEVETIASGLIAPMDLIHTLDVLWVIDSFSAFEDTYVFEQEFGFQEQPELMWLGGSTVEIVKVFFDYSLNYVRQEVVGNTANVHSRKLFKFDERGLSVQSDYWTERGLSSNATPALWMVDTKDSTILKIDPESGIWDRIIKFSGAPIPFGNYSANGFAEAEPRLTAIAISPKGFVYTSIKQSSPFLSDFVEIIKIDNCSSKTIYATNVGSYAHIDLQLGPDGKLYALQFAQYDEGTLFKGPIPETGELLRISEGISEVLLSGLNFPTALAFNHEGDAYITIDAFGTPGSAKVVKFKGIAIPENPQEERLKSCLAQPSGIAPAGMP